MPIAGAIVRVQQHDFVGLRTVDLAGVAQAQHVFGVFTLALNALAGLARHERLKALFAKLGQHGDGGDRLYAALNKETARTR